MSLTLCFVLASSFLAVPGEEPDADRDGLSDFCELHKYLTDPKKADSDGDGTPDGDWDERREYTYTVHAVIHVMAPFDVASMNDDYQDVRVLDLAPDLLEFEVVIYPFNTVASAIEPNAKWRKQTAEAKEFLAPGPCSNWDKAMQAKLVAELAERGVDLTKLDDVEAARKVSQWLMDRSQFEDSFTTFAVEFERGRPQVCDVQRDNVDETLKKFGRTLDEQWDRELFGRGMFETKIHGSCTSSAIYLSTGLRAAGIPTRTIVCTPLVDSSDEREVGWLSSRITHDGVRAMLQRSAEEQRGSWTSHTFNEVFVGGRWRRLNYTNLGQNVLDSQALGLMVHVHTFADHSEARLAGWGNRERHRAHAALFGGPNPYSCVSLSDRFGAHAQVANEMLGSLRELSISRLYWYDDPKKDPKLVANALQGVDTNSHFFVHVDTNSADGAGAYRDFFDAVDKDFVLRAEGQDDIPARALPVYWIDSGKDLREFVLRIEPADYARMKAGVEYQLAWAGKSKDLRWQVRDGATLVKPKD